MLGLLLFLQCRTSDRCSPYYIGRWQQILCPRLFLQEDNITFPQIYLVTGYDDRKQLTYILKTPVPKRFFSLFTQYPSHRLEFYMLPDILSPKTSSVETEQTF